ncbi:hypothetical protein KA183_06805 [bacterium]|nr:hypothetical protein [bacterium]
MARKKKPIGFEGSVVAEPTLWNVYEKYQCNNGLIEPVGEATPTYILEPLRHRPMFQRFIAIDTERKAIGYLEEFGFPYEPLNNRIQLHELLAVAAYIAWLKDFADCISHGDTNQLRTWIERVPTSKEELCTAAAPSYFSSDLDVELDRSWLDLPPLQLWDKLQKWHKKANDSDVKSNIESLFNECIEIEARWKGKYCLTFSGKNDFRRPHWSGMFASERFFLKGDWTSVGKTVLISRHDEFHYPYWKCHANLKRTSNDADLLTLAKYYLIYSVNLLMAGISPRLELDGQKEQIAYYRMRSPWQVICMSLYFHITGANRIDSCPFPGCDSLVPMNQGSRSCGRSRCQKWVTATKGKRNHYPSKRKSATQRSRK